MKNIMSTISMAILVSIIPMFLQDASAQTTQKRLPPPDFGVAPSNHARVIGWPDGSKPIAPPGFKVSVYADGFENSRWLYVLPNGDVLVSEGNQPPKPEDQAEPCQAAPIFRSRYSWYKPKPH